MEENFPDLSCTEDIILVTITFLPSDSYVLADIINLLCENDVSIDIIASPPVSSKGACLTFTVEGCDIDKLLKISTMLKKFYSRISFSINCTNVKFRVFNIFKDQTRMLFTSVLTVLKNHDIPVRFVICAKNEFLIITDNHYCEFACRLIKQTIK